MAVVPTTARLITARALVKNNMVMVEIRTKENNQEGGGSGVGAVLIVSRAVMGHLDLMWPR